MSIELAVQATQKSALTPPVLNARGWDPYDIMQEISSDVMCSMWTSLPMSAAQHHMHLLREPTETP